MTVCRIRQKIISYRIVMVYSLLLSESLQCQDWFVRRERRTHSVAMATVTRVCTAMCPRDDVIGDALHQRVRRRANSSPWRRAGATARVAAVAPGGRRLYGRGGPRAAAARRSDQSRRHATNERHCSHAAHQRRLGRRPGTRSLLSYISRES